MTNFSFSFVFERTELVHAQTYTHECEFLWGWQQGESQNDLDPNSDPFQLALFIWRQQKSFASQSKRLPNGILYGKADTMTVPSDIESPTLIDKRT